jgi:adenylate cyclase
MSSSRIFVSYSRADDAIARQIIEGLRASNLVLWVDQDDILPGQRWDQAIEQALEQCSDVLVLLSSRSAVSDVVLDEINYALERKKRVLPVVIESCNIPLRLKRLESVRFDADYDASLQRVLRAITENRAQPLAPADAEASFAFHPGQRHKPSIAVLPFDSLNATESSRVLSDGLLTEIVEALSRNSELFVIASATTRGYRDKTRNVDEIAKQLRVSYLLIGQLTVLDKRLRVACELVSSGSGRVVWTEHFDRDIADLFVVQDAIARAIAHQLQRGLGTHERNKIIRKAPESLSAWEIFQQARYYEWSYDWLTKSITLLKRAIELDPELAEAHALLAARMAYMIWYGHLNSVAQSLTHAARALELAPDNANCLVCSSVAQNYNGNHQKALNLVERALEVNPNSADAWGYNGLYLAVMGRNKEALDMLDYAFELSPKDPVRYLWYAHKAICYVNQDDYETALDLFTKSTGLHDQWFWSFMAQAQSHAMLGHSESARRDWQHAKRLNGSLSLANLRVWLTASTLTREQQNAVVDALRNSGCE